MCAGEHFLVVLHGILMTLSLYDATIVIGVVGSQSMILILTHQEKPPLLKTGSEN